MQFNYNMKDSYYLVTTNRVVFDFYTEDIDVQVNTPIVRFRATQNGAILKELTVENGGLTILSQYSFQINPFKQTLSPSNYIGGVRIIFDNGDEKEYITFTHTVQPTAAYKGR